MPLFSILIPTKNRAGALNGALASLDSQTFKDFEVVIADNSDEEQQVNWGGFSYPYPLQCIKTGGLPMHENWEIALNAATGGYIILLTDKMRLRPNALQELASTVMRYPGKVISYDCQLARKDLSKPAKVKEPVIFESKAFMDKMADFRPEFFVQMPKVVASAVPLEIIRMIQADSGRFFTHISADYVAGFKLLSVIDNFVYLDSPLMFESFEFRKKCSNNYQTYRGGPTNKDFVSKLPVSKDEILKYSPFGSRKSWVNDIVYDYYKNYKRGNYTPSLKTDAFCSYYLMHILYGLTIGGNMREEWTEFRKFLKTKTFYERILIYCGGFERFMAQAIMNWKQCLK